ncbi:MAG: hypothetical protein RBR35_03045 [Salinivirgaceae bacterium]|nr:hypothetical protein [Salinivirgaceae bacterium]
MKKTKNEPLKGREKSTKDFDRDSRVRKASDPLKQKKALSIYDDFEEEEEVEEIVDIDENDEPNSIWDYYDDDDD